MYDIYSMFGQCLNALEPVTVQGIVGVSCIYGHSGFSHFAVIDQLKFEYYFRKILPVGTIPTTINSQQARSIESCPYVCSVLYILTRKYTHK